MDLLKNRWIWGVLAILIITGWSLANDPQDIPFLGGGQVVEIEETGVDDWILRRADGTREGGFSAEALRADKEGK